MMKGNRLHVCIDSPVLFLRAFSMSSTVFMTEQASDHLPGHPSVFSLWSSLSCPLRVFIKETESWSCNSWRIVFHILGDFTFKDPYFQLTIHTQNALQQWQNAWLRTDTIILVLVWTQRSLWSMLLQCTVNPQVFRIQTWYERHCTLLWVNIILSLFKLQSLKRKDKSCVTKARFLKIDDLFLTEVSSLFTVN